MQFVARIFLLLTLAALSGCASGQVRPGTGVLARFFLEAPGGDGLALTLPRSGTRVVVRAKPVLTEFDVIDVQVARVELGDCLLFKLSPASSRDLYRLTGANHGSRLVVVVNGEPLGARRIDHAFDEGSILMFVELSDAALQPLAQRLRTTAEQLRPAS